MSKKILVIGCSHSAGAYDDNDKVISNESWVWHLANIRNNSDSYYVIHNPGNGIMHYGAIVKHLHNSGQLAQFDSCIVQMTHEMRMMFYDNKSNGYYDMLETWLHNADDKFNQRPDYEYFDSKYRTLSYYGSDVYDTYESYFATTEAKESWLNVSQRILEGIVDTYTVNSMYDIYYDYIVNTLKQNDVEPIVFDWWGKVLNNNLIRGDEWILDSVMETAKSKGVWYPDKMTPIGQHHNSESANLMAQIIQEAIVNNGKLR